MNTLCPVIAIVGRPNVGKSTLFNCLTRTKNALVVDLPGTTRDRQFGEGKVGDHPYILVDTAGLGYDESDVETDMSRQSWQAAAEADAILFVVDARVGVTPLDIALAKQLRLIDKPKFLVANKTDGLDPQVAVAEFFSLSLGNPLSIAASHNRGVAQLADYFLEPWVAQAQAQAVAASDRPDTDALAALGKSLQQDSIKVAVVGQPNVGKSTLINRILGEERVVVADEAGTTRDSIFIPFERDAQSYLLIDTAGVRRKSKVKEVVEKFSVIKTLQSIEACHVVLVLIDAQRGILDQDLSLLDFVIDTGKSLVIAINKWDGLTGEQRLAIKKQLGYRLQFVDFAEQHFISALHGTGVGNLFGSIKKAYASAMQTLSTPMLTRLLKELVTKHTPPLVRGRRIKLRYAHTGGHNPPRVVVHGNQTEDLPKSYRRYLSNGFRKALKLTGTPVYMQFKTGDNPYKDNKNTLTPRQEKKRKRLMRHVKKSASKS